MLDGTSALVDQLELGQYEMLIGHLRLEIGEQRLLQEKMWKAEARGLLLELYAQRFPLERMLEMLAGMRNRIIIMKMSLSLSLSYIYIHLHVLLAFWFFCVDMYFVIVSGSFNKIHN